MPTAAEMNPLYKKFQELTDRKLSKALRFMYEGLLEFDADPSFKVTMSSYGFAHAGVCYGCAATCAIQKAFSVRYTPASIENVEGRGRALLKVIPDMETEFFGELYNLETGYDQTRRGSSTRLCVILGIPPVDLPFAMSTENWRDGMGPLITFIEELEAHGA